MCQLGTEPGRPRRPFGHMRRIVDAEEGKNPFISAVQSLITVVISSLDMRRCPPHWGARGTFKCGGSDLGGGRYLNRLELTEQRFRPICWELRARSQLFQDGDLALHCRMATHSVLGVWTTNIKISRGMRIELGEIERRSGRCGQEWPSGGCGGARGLDGIKRCSLRCADRCGRRSIMSGGWCRKPRQSRSKDRVSRNRTRKHCFPSSSTCAPCCGGRCQNTCSIGCLCFWRMAAATPKARRERKALAATGRLSPTRRG